MSGGISKINSIFELDTVFIDSKPRNFSPKTEIMCRRLQELWQKEFLQGGFGSGGWEMQYEVRFRGNIGDQVMGSKMEMNWDDVSGICL